MRLFPLRATWKLSRMMADLGYYALGRNRRLAIANLSLVYGKSKSPTEIREMAREVFRCGAGCALELMLYAARRGHTTDVYDLVNEVRGLEYLDRSLRKNRGVVGLSAHLGNFVLTGGKLNILGYRCTSIMRQMRDEQLEEIFTRLRDDLRQPTIPKLPLSRSVRRALSWLSQGNILIIHFDQRSRTGATVDFFGLPTSTATGAAFFALESRAAVHPMFAIRRDDGYYKLIIGPAVDVIDTGNRKADSHANTARFAKVVESYIRQYPTQWFWFDRRWRRFHKTRH